MVRHIRRAFSPGDSASIARFPDSATSVQDASGRWITVHSSALASAKPIDANMGCDEIKGRSAKTDDNDPVH